ncbi:toll/interleukin-1 receptor domain-containing protein [Cellulomonas sp. SLBN-39]|uniref:tetratricopeptide repeat protein n=1 Tax=Cellulomonas sp. SLBN-39 TaxID=2768446 RepID=UPI00114E0919|nr:toll/interleukin-1 receptor domain-containing protein [Cellulomonas sp. SLBN-39]TQL03187.1 tetratricopeptide repeat protein [Cellulomonas sp. SLBN-39]
MTTEAGDEADFFISYAKDDGRRWAEWIAWTLEEAGLTTILQAWDFVPGSSFINEMHQASASARRTIALLSRNYIASDFAAVEWQAAYREDPLGASQKLLVARIEECTRPGLLGSIVSFDLFGVGEEEAKRTLLRSVRADRSSRMKPSQAPTFPSRRDSHSTRPDFPFARRQAWNIPPRNAHHLDRISISGGLSALFEAEPGTAIATLIGIGGAGKSEAAAEWVHANREGYAVCWWVDGRSQTTVTQGLVSLLSELGRHPQEDEGSDAILEAPSVLSEVGDWIVLFDGADDPDVIRNTLSTFSAIESTVRSHVIVTSRNSTVGGFGKMIPVHVWNDLEALAYIGTRGGSSSISGAIGLAGLLGGLPLALDQAASYMLATGIDPAEYAQLFTEHTAEMLRKGAPAANSDPMITLWDISLADLKARSLAASQLINLCAYFSDARIPVDLFRDQHSALPSPLAEVAGDGFEIHEAVALLHEMGLARYSSGSFRLHKLTQAAIRATHARSQSIEELACATPALYLLRTALPSFVIGKSETTGPWRELFPHVMSAVWNMQSTDKSDSHSALLAGQLLSDAGAFAQFSGAHDMARELLSSALELEQERGENGETRAHRLNDLALSLKASQRPREALPLAEEAVALMRKSVGSHDINTATDISTLAKILDDLNDFSRARELLEEAIQITKEALGPRSRPLARRFNDLSLVHLHLGDSQVAFDLIEKSEAMAREILGDEHPEYAAILANMGSIHHALGRSEAARKCLFRSLEILDNISTRHPHSPMVMVEILKLDPSSTDAAIEDVRKRMTILGYAA